uniref:Uncharacterized protein n=2 Tax=Trichobilharzia regenti TaxID=157069 RepID=A0AA85JUR8_TRIRE|nr:unnamed protein product [Trichobilharzia regenti]CAH8833358.1 unnamed protein product [Trichobilharzia regenti]
MTTSSNEVKNENQTTLPFTPSDELSSTQESVNSRSNIEPVSNQSSVERRTWEFIWKTFIIVSVQITIVWEICALVLLVSQIYEWMKENTWFSWTCGILGTVLQLEMLLIPQLQFAFPYNYIYLIIATIIVAFAAAVPLIDLPFWWTFVTWIITVIIAGIVVAVSVVNRFDVLKSFGEFILVTFIVELAFVIIFFPFIFWREFDILIILCGFAMMWTVISEIAIIVQALLGDRRFTFRNNQHVLCGLIIAMLIIWLHLLVSTEVAIFIVSINRTEETGGRRLYGTSADKYLEL